MSASRQIAVVTGAAGRKGRAIVARLEGDGYTVAGIDLRPSPGTMAIIADVADRAATASAIASVVERLGPISVLVTAVDVDEGGPFGSLDDGRWRSLLGAILGGTGNACAAVLPGMLDARGGTIVTLASDEALGAGTRDVYRAAASGTLLAFTKSLAVEVAPRGVRLNCVAGGSPESVAETVAFLARDGGFYVGQVFMPAGEKA